jgi:hypothetical protein
MAVDKVKCEMDRPSLFLIIFATVGGRATSKIASYKLEQGVSLRKLEQLAGSKTLGSTISCQYHARGFNLLGIGLLSLWAISPLGGQAALRILETEAVKEITPTNVIYFNTDTPSNLVSEIQTSVDTTFQWYYSNIGALYISTLFTPLSIKNSTMDLWGNAKIPILSSYAGSSDVS